jgi:hypothetical protein
MIPTLLFIASVLTIVTAAYVVVTVYKDRKARHLPLFEPWHW